MTVIVEENVQRITLKLQLSSSLFRYLRCLESSTAEQLKELEEELKNWKSIPILLLGEWMQ